MANDRISVTPTRRESYGFERYRVTPVTTISGKRTHRNIKKKTEHLIADVPFCLDTHSIPVKCLFYKNSPYDDYKIAVRKRIGKHLKRRAYNK